MTLVYHLIPYEGIGGVERAASTMKNYFTHDINFNVVTIYPSSIISSKWLMWAPFYFYNSLVDLRKSKPDILIVSLWRAYFVGIIHKFIFPEVKLVLFLHYPKSVHFIDDVLTRLGANFAFKIWADSLETQKKRLTRSDFNKQRVISFVTERLSELDSSAVTPTFIFWGRIHPQKGLIRAIGIFSKILFHHSDAQFWIIGPDGGDLFRVESVIESMDIGHAVHLIGPKKFLEISQIAKNVSFYLQTSELEGMAMSVVEAMQFGILPVVTPVGEIVNYTEDGINAILITEDSKAVDDILELIENNTIYQEMRTTAIDAWRDKELYKDSVISACREIMYIDKNK